MEQVAHEEVERAAALDMTTRGAIMVQAVMHGTKSGIVELCTQARMRTPLSRTFLSFCELHDSLHAFRPQHCAPACASAPTLCARVRFGSIIVHPRVLRPHHCAPVCASAPSLCARLPLVHDQGLGLLWELLMITPVHVFLGSFFFHAREHYSRFKAGSGRLSREFSTVIFCFRPLEGRSSLAGVHRRSGRLISRFPITVALFLSFNYDLWKQLVRSLDNEKGGPGKPPGLWRDEKGEYTAKLAGGDQSSSEVPRSLSPAPVPMHGRLQRCIFAWKTSMQPSSIKPSQN
ncbi:hypothetical protein VOLCADRAFT_97902 [Volvox carteri f. nagariensis]|uniref:Uncharacterized protein n=1 Tax=Volvox carteri f. nagariensis TaxID=3068 RepID=D8UDY2_VOLCA|nr:uncharacterized protein VOLCADRAFT_97902 [Volvox carteri f. nagariensis]EFJ42032.1 hypothetical protein VOLCADRAFT_97902 [Volvox carteri f. nagariensis]|eukprot:XP_002956907.1 hypothetical protein VOLCADRAFT_97902 [Volvox carteri f. nagariensis]